MSVARPFVQSQPFYLIRQYILERNLTNVMSVARSLLTAQISGDIRKFIQDRIYLNVIYVTKSSGEVNSLLIISVFILETNLTNVMSIASILVNLHSS